MGSPRKFIMKTYKWHGDEWHDEDEWDDIHGEDMRDAARRVAEKLEELDHEILELDFVVANSELTTKKRYVVTKEYYTRFHATELPLQ